jgi:hypothetical protein
MDLRGFCENSTLPEDMDVGGMEEDIIQPNAR